MPRPTSIPVCPDPPPPKSINTYSYQIELITPLFGGGVIARENDPSFPIRPTSIRGQLQFWWRATIGAQHLTKEDLRAAQTSLWGGVTSTGGQPSRVLVGVTNLSVGKATPCAEYKLDGNRYRAMPDWDPIFRNKALPYALFPFQGQLANRGTDIEIPPAEFIGKASFKLTLGCSSSLVEQIKPALWAWVNLGGLGSRTRRGCGAIRCTEFSAQDRNDLIAQLRRYLSAPPPKIGQLWPRRRWSAKNSAIRSRPGMRSSKLTATFAKAKTPDETLVINLTVPVVHGGQNLRRSVGSQENGVRRIRVCHTSPTTPSPALNSVCPSFFTSKIEMIHQTPCCTPRLVPRENESGWPAR